MRKVSLAALAGVASIVAGAHRATAALTLTAQGTTDGFSLATFASGFPNTSTIGPLGMTFTPTGGVMVADYPGNVRVFPTDVNNQSAGTVTAAQNYGQANAVGLATIGSNIYMTEQTAGKLVLLNLDGTFNKNISTGVPVATGLLYDPFNGQLYVSEGGQNIIAQVNPTTGVTTTFTSVTNPDGMSLSADGSVLYTASNGTNVAGFNTSGGARVFTSATVSTVDGTAVGTGALAGNIFANCNNGTVIQINISTGTLTTIATGGSRGDFVTVDPKDGSLLLTQTDSILRLSGNGVFVHPIISLNTTAPASGYGNQLTNGTGTDKGAFTTGANILTVAGNHGSYFGAEVTGINAGTGATTDYVASSGFSPTTDKEIYALDVLVGGVQATPAQIATLVADINSSNPYGYGSSIASGTDPTHGSFAILSPFENYDLYLTFNGLSSASNFLGFDLTQDPNFPGQTLTVTAVAVVPEPTTTALGTIGLSLLLTRRSQRMTAAN